MAFSEFTGIARIENVGAHQGVRTIDFDLSSKPGKTPFPTAGTGAIFARTRFAYIEGTSIQFAAIDRADRGLGLGIVVHRDEGEAARFAGHSVHHQANFVDGAVLFEQILKIVLGGLKREITNVQFHLF